MRLRSACGYRAVIHHLPSVNHSGKEFCSILFIDPSASFFQVSPVNSQPALQRAKTNAAVTLIRNITGCTVFLAPPSQQDIVVFPFLPVFYTGNRCMFFTFSCDVLPDHDNGGLCTEFPSAERLRVTADLRFGTFYFWRVLLPP